MRNSELKIYAIAVVGLLSISTTPNCFGFTLPSDVEALVSLHEAMEFPELKGWVSQDGDPCKDHWQGVQCEGYKIAKVVLNNLDIHGQLSRDLGDFSSIQVLDLSHNKIWNNIPGPLPRTLKILLLNNNLIEGDLPDAFSQLKNLTYLDLSQNHITNELPPSMANLTSLSTFHIQNNHMTHSLEVLQNLPLINLNVANNYFEGPVPPSLLSIPNFRYDGCNLTFPPPPSSNSSSNIVVWLGFLILVLLALGLYMFVSRSGKQNSINEVGDHIKNYILNVFSSNQSHHNENETSCNDNGRNDPLPSPKRKKKKKTKSKNSPPPLSPEPLNEIVIETEPVPTTGPSSSLITDLPKSFSLSSLQQYTNSFSQENLIGRGLLGEVYRAHLPDGKLLAVKKLEIADSSQWSDKDFKELVSNVSKLQNENIVGLVGYCCKHGEQILVYEHCNNGTLHEALHVDEDIHMKLSWKARFNITLQAAKALEYLHEADVVHQNFKSANIMLDEDLNAHVSDCALAPLIPSSYNSKLQASGYGAPELESGSYTYQSDVYSFGVVMLELLTGRKVHHRSKTRGEQYLVKWAVPKLHDIDELTKMVDASLDDAYSSKSLSRFGNIISRCVQPEPELRPPMSEIVQSLEHLTRSKR